MDNRGDWLGSVGATCGRPWATQQTSTVIADYRGLDEMNFLGLPPVDPLETFGFWPSRIFFENTGPLVLLRKTGRVATPIVLKHSSRLCVPGGLKLRITRFAGVYRVAASIVLKHSGRLC